jgi:hypothetical protein
MVTLLSVPGRPPGSASSGFQVARYFWCENWNSYPNKPPLEIYKGILGGDLYICEIQVVLKIASRMWNIIFKFLSEILELDFLQLVQILRKLDLCEIYLDSLILWLLLLCWNRKWSRLWSLLLKSILITYELKVHCRSQKSLNKIW